MFPFLAFPWDDFRLQLNMSFQRRCLSWPQCPIVLHPPPTPAPFPNLLDFRPEKLVLKSDGYTCPYLPNRVQPRADQTGKGDSGQLLTTLSGSDTSNSRTKEPLS